MTPGCFFLLFQYRIQNLCSGERSFVDLFERKTDRVRLWFLLLNVFRFCGFNRFDTHGFHVRLFLVPRLIKQPRKLDSPGTKAARLKLKKVIHNARARESREQ